MSDRIDKRTWVAVSGATVALLVAIISAYINLDRRVFASLTADQVEHVIDLKTTSKLDEILRRLDRIEAQLEGLHLGPGRANVGISEGIPS